LWVFLIISMALPYIIEKRRNKDVTIVTND
jgi:hypothetical protein